VQLGIAYVEVGMWKMSCRAIYWTKLDCVALGLSSLHSNPSMRNLDDFSLRIVTVGVWIITRSGESCINMFIRNISIIDSSRIVIYLMHCDRIEGAWFRLGAYLSSIRSKTSHQLV
jgi:hypothetical protein